MATKPPDANTEITIRGSTKWPPKEVSDKGLVQYLRLARENGDTVREKAYQEEIDRRERLRLATNAIRAKSWDTFWLLNDIYHTGVIQEPYATKVKELIASLGFKT